MFVCVTTDSGTCPPPVVTCGPVTNGTAIICPGH
jgi:hypothetical protein